MSEMTDRVTDALWDKYLREGGPWRSLIDKSDIREVVNSVFALMRKPTEAMWTAGADIPWSERGPSEMWETMIDEARKD